MIQVNFIHISGPVGQTLSNDRQKIAALDRQKIAALDRQKM